ncbi:IS1634 family transposase [Patescibacteria group bacterium]|nr:IS1634 family transposase [Patescibacteria group bacterium]
MFIREKTSPTTKRTYLQIIRSYRTQGKIRQKIIASLGCLQELQEKNEIKKLARSLLKFCSQRQDITDFSSLKENNRYYWGAVKIIRKIWEQLKLSELLSSFSKSAQLKFDYFSAVFLMVIERLVNPCSKWKSYQNQDKYYGISKVDSQHLYRALDVLASNKEKLEKELFERNVSLFNMSVDVVFFDVTTLYFESQKISDLKLFGFSKDCKVNEVQVVVSLIIDKEGRPIGFDVFPGNTFEGKTMESAVKKLKKNFNIDRLIFVGDRGVFSAGNFEILKENNYEYIISSRIKSKSKAVKEKILDGKWDYEKEEEKGEVFKYKEIGTKGERLIITWSSKRARKDRADRERLIKRAEELLEGNRVANKAGARKYLKVEVEKAELNQEKIELDARWDGYYGIETNNDDLSAGVVVERYKDLWRIEESFRILKSHLETRPIFHWTEKRILGHLVLCFLAFLLERILELELKRNEINYSASGIREALNSLQVSEVEIEGRTFLLRSRVEGLANDILRCFKIKIPPNFTTPELF